MSSSISVPKPCLLAVLLVCQTRSGSGPQLVLEWPLRTSEDSPVDSDEGDGSASHDSEDSESSSTSDDERTQHSADGLRPRATLNSRSVSTAAYANTLDEGPDQNGDIKLKTLFGLDEDGLLSLLAPNRTWHKRKFELTINDLTFVGRPIHARQDGSWQRRRRRKKTHKDLDFEEQSTDDEPNLDVQDTEMLTELPDSVKSELTMFHIVFVLQTPPLDHVRCVKEMYDNVVKKLSRALKVLQVQHDYVWQQVDTFLSSKQKGSTSLEHLASRIEDNPLMKALATMFNAISTSKIASLELMPGIQLPLQIPPITSTTYLPSLSEPPIPPGLWLTTATEAATSVNASENSATTSLQLAKSYTLLLRSAPQKIARDARAGSGPLSEHLPRFVTALKPTKSFWKISVEDKISLADIQLLARHLIYWRRAVLIPPLHQRDTYIISPNADFRRLAEATRNFEQHFSAPIPALPKLLCVLSGVPRPYGTIIPSSDHKEVYMFVLAWLLRNGFVTQLRTFAYVKASAEIKKTSAERDRESRSSVNSNGDQGSGSSEPSGQQRPSFVSRQSSDGRQSVRDARNLKLSSLIKSPAKATPEESRWLISIQNSILEDGGMFADLTQEERQELHHYWPRFIKYFDGTIALETIFIKESSKRKITWSILGKLGLSFDGSVERSHGNDSLMVTVRHW